LEVIDLEQLDQREEEEAEAKKKVREMEVSEERLLREIEDAKIVDEGNEGGAEGDNL
jgi:hypothetical protein